MSFANAVPTKHSLSQLQSGQGPLMPKNEPKANPGGLEDFINELNQATNLRLRIQDDAAQEGRVKIKKNPETKESKPNPELQILQKPDGTQPNPANPEGEARMYKLIHIFRTFPDWDFGSSF